MTITPDQAQELLDGSTPGLWRLDQQDSDEPPMVMALREENGLLLGTYITEWVEEYSDARLIAAAPDMAETIAGMKTEYALETLWGTGADWAVTTGWFPTPERAWADLVLDAGPTRLVRRVVSETEVVES